MLVFKNIFQVLFTGLQRLIGSPEDYSKIQNKDDEYFAKKYDLAFSVQETD